MIPSSGIYYGPVSHVRHQPVKNSFTYQYTMLGLDLDQLTNFTGQSLLFGTSWFHPFRFNEKDYLKSEPGELKQRIANKVRQLGGNWSGNKVFMVAQCRTLGLYFSPINFYYCYDKKDNVQLLLAEVSNTPWNERHYYLVDMKKVNANVSKEDVEQLSDKTFHVSPFMDVNMKYKWKLSPPSDVVKVIIENIPKANAMISESEDGKFNKDKKAKVTRFFTAAMSLRKKQFSSFSLFIASLSLPFTVLKMLVLIYWQALKLWTIGVPFVPYEKN